MTKFEELRAKAVLNIKKFADELNTTSNYDALYEKIMDFFDTTTVSKLVGEDICEKCSCDPMEDCSLQCSIDCASYLDKKVN